MTIEQKRDELIELLADAFALGRLSTSAYERFVTAVAKAGDFQQLMRLANIVQAKLYVESAPQRAAVAPTQLRDDGEERPRATPATLVGDFYRALSWQAGHAPNRGTLEQLVDRSVHFINGGRVLTLGEFWTYRVDMWVRRSLLPFFQREVEERTTVFGDIAHRLSIYEAVLANGKLAGRGLNSIQLYRSDRWRIVSVAWDEWQEGMSLPSL